MCFQKSRLATPAADQHHAERGRRADPSSEQRLAGRLEGSSRKTAPTSPCTGEVAPADMALTVGETYDVEYQAATPGLTAPGDSRSGLPQACDVAAEVLGFKISATESWCLFPINVLRGQECPEAFRIGVERRSQERFSQRIVLPGMGLESANQCLGYSNLQCHVQVLQPDCRNDAVYTLGCVATC